LKAIKASNKDAEEHDLSEAIGGNAFDNTKEAKQLARAIEKCGGVGVATRDDVQSKLGIYDAKMREWLKMSSIYKSEAVGKGRGAKAVIVRRT